MLFRKLNSISIIRITFSMIFFSIVVMHAAVDPKSYTTIYVGLIRTIGNEQLLKNYQDNLKELQLSDKMGDASFGDDLRIVQLPIFRVPILKIIISEMQRRHLITEPELNKVQKLIKEKEDIINKGGQRIR